MSDTNKHQFSSFKHFERNNAPKFYIILFVILSILMIVCGKIFHIHDWVTHPQFTEEGVTSAWFYKHTSLFQELIFVAFFIFDFVWAFLLFYIVGRYVHNKATKHKKRKLFIAYLVLASIAYTFDCTENFHYLFYKEYPATIVSLKIGFYAITFLMVLLILLRYSLKDRLVLLKEFVYSSWISLLFLFIIGLSLPKAPQLNSIIVDLYYHPYWFVFVLLLGFAPIYCIVLSHYPAYFLLSRSNRKFQDKEWKMRKAFSVFGIIWYKNKDSKSDPKSIAYESNLSFLRRTIGIFFYAALFYMVAYTADTNFGFGVELSGFVRILIVALIFWLYVLKNQKDIWRTYYSKGLRVAKDTTFDLYSFGGKGKEKKEPKVNNPITTYLIILAITLLVHFALLFLLLLSEHPYNYTTVILSLVCITLQAITYTYYRTFRTLFKYAFFNEDNEAIIKSFPIMSDENDTRSSEEKKKAIVQMFKENHYFGQSPLFRKISKLRLRHLSLGAASNNVIFLKVISYFGVANFLFFLSLNLFPRLAMHVNAIIIIMSAFFLLYGIVVVILKHFIYYNLSEEKFAKDHKSHFRFTIYAALLGLVILNFLARSNNLFELAQIKETVTTDKINLKKYIQNLPDTRYYVGCYGGGMKANAWTMTVLNAIDQDGTLYDKTVCLSGASGGTIGLINYSAIKHQNDNVQFRDSIIRKIGTENILSMDLAHLLGRDWLLHVLAPVNLIGMDRSTAAMWTYAQYTNDAITEEEFKTTSYRQQWYDMYQKRNQRFPILISNTTNIKGRQGMAVSIPMEDSHAKKVLYLGANDILELNNNKTLSYYNAASTTNRFPLISPAATIEGEGQYNDGGIYENSGLLSAYKLYEAINEIDPKAKEKKTVFINIINDKSAYIKSIMNPIMEECSGGVINKSSEISAILNSVAATEMFPGYIKDKLQLLDDKHEHFTFESIYLPHKFDLEDVRALYGQKIKDTDCVVQIAQIIKDNNKSIKDLMEGCLKETNTIIEPEMSRVMAVPAFDFMQYMLQHERVKTVLDNL